MQIPVSASDITTAWLNEAMARFLGEARVIDCRARDSEIPGQTAEIILIDVTYDRETDCGDHLVAKVTSRDKMIVEELIPLYDQYRRETSFYREFPDPGLAVPSVYHLDYNAGTQAFVILMKDLAPSTCPSWAPTPAQVETGLAALPQFHARWWNDPVLREKDWMVQYDNAAFLGAAFDAANAGRDEIARRIGGDTSLVAETMALLSGKKEAVLAWLATRNFSFVHGDYHSKQMFFPTEEGGEFAVIDWQFPFVAPGAWDFARLMGMCLATPDRVAMQDDLMEKYVAGLAVNGVEGYGQEDFLDDFRLGLCVSQTIMCVATVDTDISIFEKECGELGLDWKEPLLYRTQAAMEEWDALALVKSM